MEIAVIGGGAAGFFAAIACAEADPGLKVTLLEKSAKVLSKVRISGGGRCNVTHDCLENTKLVQGYPRGSRELRGPFERFAVKETIAWFERRGVALKIEPDGRMFPTTDDSGTIVACLEQAAARAGVRVALNSGVRMLEPQPGGGFQLTLSSGEHRRFDRVLVATGGSPTLAGFDWLARLGHTIVPPVPSLFTFNLDDHPLAGLEGLSAPQAHLRIEGSKLEQTGPLLVTHWGLSGPAVLRLSAWGARELQLRDYTFPLLVHWVHPHREEALREQLNRIRQEQPRKQLGTFSPVDLPLRLWRWMLERAGVPEDRRWAELGKKELNGLLEALTRSRLQVRGKSTFKEEFVTAGGVSLKEVDMRTMESRRCPGLYFAGEVLDIDGVTGGFNFQAAWTTGYIAGTQMASSSARSDDGTIDGRRDRRGGPRARGHAREPVSALRV